MRRLTKFQQESKKVLQKSQGHYKKDFDENFRVTTPLGRRDLVYLYRPPNFAFTATDKITLETKSKLLPNTTRPYQVPQVTPETVMIEDNGLPNTISIDLVTTAPINHSSRYTTDDSTPSTKDGTKDMDEEVSNPAQATWKQVKETPNIK